VNYKIEEGQAIRNLSVGIGYYETYKFMAQRAERTPDSLGHGQRIASQTENGWRLSKVYQSPHTNTSPIRQLQQHDLCDIQRRDRRSCRVSRLPRGPSA